MTGFKGDISNIQSSAQVQPGNSGGPLISEKGELIGVTNAKHSNASDAGYAIKIAYVQNFLAQTEIEFSKSTDNNSGRILDKLESYSKWIYIIESYVE